MLLKRLKESPAILAVFAYLLIFILFTYPLIGSLSHAFIGDLEGDAGLFFWSVRHFVKAFPNLKDIFFTRDLFYPHGVPLYSHLYITGLVSLFFKSPYLPYNLVLLASFALSGLGAFLLARRFIANPFLCFLAGFLFAFCPYKLVRLQVHYNLTLTAAVPFLIMAFMDAFQFKNGSWPIIKSWKKLWLFFFLFFLCILCDYIISFHVVYFLTAYALYFFIPWKKFSVRSHKTWVLAAVVLVGFHFLIYFLRQKGMDDKGAYWWTGDIISFLVPHYNSRWLYNDFWSDITAKPWFHPIAHSIETTLFMGYSFLLLAFFTLWKGRKVPWNAPVKPFIFVSCILLMMSVPVIRFHGHDLLNLPTGILHFIPFINNIRVASRVIGLVMLALPVVVFYFYEHYLTYKWSLTKINFSALCLFIVFLFEFFPKHYSIIKEDNVPPVVYHLKASKGEVVLNIPSGLKDGLRMSGFSEVKGLYFQTIHQKSMLDGYTSRLRPQVFEFFEKSSVMRAILKYSADTSYSLPDNRPDARDSFNRIFHPDFVLIYPGYDSPELRKFLNQVFGGKLNSAITDEKGYTMVDLRR